MGRSRQPLARRQMGGLLACHPGRSIVPARVRRERRWHRPRHRDRPGSGGQRPVHLVSGLDEDPDRSRPTGAATRRTCSIRRVAPGRPSHGSPTPISTGSASRPSRSSDPGRVVIAKRRAGAPRRRRRRARERAHLKVRERARGVGNARMGAQARRRCHSHEKGRTPGGRARGSRCMQLGCGERIRTSDLRVMSPTSCRCSTPRPLTLGLRARSGQTRVRVQFVRYTSVPTEARNSAGVR